MPTQNQYSQAVLKAQLVTANNGNAIILSEMSGCEADWSKALCQFRQIQGAEFCLSVEDYTSDTAVYFYNEMLEIAGLNYLDGVTLDPNAQMPDGIIIITTGGSGIDYYYDETFLIDSGGGNWYLPLVDPESGDALPANYRPVLLTLNGASFYPTFDENFTPTRLYGFSDNTGPKFIIVTIIIT